MIDVMWCIVLCYSVVCDQDIDIVCFEVREEYGVKRGMCVFLCVRVLGCEGLCFVLPLTSIKL